MVTFAVAWTLTKRFVGSTLIGVTSPDTPPPMIVALNPGTLASGRTTKVTGRNFLPGAVVLLAEAPTAYLTLDYIDAEHLWLTTMPSLPSGDILISIANPDGKHSNTVPLYIDEDPVD